MNLIVALGRDGAIGKNGDLIWRIPDDLKHFKRLTMGHPVIMGRKTWESLPVKPLPGRRNIVLSGNQVFKAEGAEVFKSIDEILRQGDLEDTFVIGGSSIYKLFLPYVEKLYLTLIEDECKDADTFLPLNLEEWDLTEESPGMKSPEGVPYKFATYIRKKK